MSLKLYNILTNGYAHKNKNLGDYEYDKKLSNRNEQVYYNKNTNKMLFNVNGTNPFSPRDIMTDVYLAFGGLKLTNRYKEAEQTLKNARNKYNPQETTLTGHSLGGSITSYLGSKGANDKIITLDKGATIGQKTRNIEKAYRTEADVVSLLNANSKHMTTLHNNNIKTGILPIDALNAHNVSNIKNEKIFV
jgi:hypothetical protein